MATLTSTITETVTINGAARGSTNTLTITGVDDIYHRVVTVPSGVDTTLASFKSTVGIADNCLDVQNVKYIRVTNMDASNPVNLSLQISYAEDDNAPEGSATILVEAGNSFVMGTPHDGISAQDDNLTIETSLFDLESIIADSTSTAVQVEIFIASVVA
tara:strand:- start:183 stop:659 length:477 start_codon:yes stop_codon:yes gene_type:complete